MRTRLVALFLFLAASLSAAPWWQQAPGPAYQVLIYSFADSNGDGYGDLAGLTNRLDEVAKLGTSALWLSPLHPSPSYHGYDVTDYKAVNPKLGTLADFDALVAAAHARGIHVFLDLVFNHTSTRHPWFTERRDWYVNRKSDVTYGGRSLGGWANRGDGSAYFSSFDGASMADLDQTNPAVVAEEKSILKFWLDRGVDGFRFDAAMWLFSSAKMPEGTPVVARTKAFWNDLRDYARSLNPEVYFIGEVYSTSLIETVAYSGAFDGLFDFTLAQTLVGLAQAGEVSSFAAKEEANLKAHRKNPGFVLSPFLANHDQDRPMSVTLGRFGALPAPGWGPAPTDTAAMTAAKAQSLVRNQDQAFVYLTLPGLPYIEYGEELGMTGRRFRDDDYSRRDAYPWGDANAGGTTTTWMQTLAKREAGMNALTPTYSQQDADPASLLNWYRALGTLRQSHPALRSMGYAVCAWPGANDGTVVSYFREGGGEKLLATVNFGPAPVSITVPAGTDLKPLLANKPAPQGKLVLAPGQAILWSVGP